MRPMDNRIQWHFKKGAKHWLTKAKCTNANGNRQHAADVTVTA
jgi:hypothetical protein